MRHAARPPRRSLLLAVLLALTGCSAGGGAEPLDGPAVGETSAAIINGVSSPASQDSVVRIQMGLGFCSGTLIAPNLVLTARHCVTNFRNDECGTIRGDVPVETMSIAVGGSASELTAPVAHATKYFYNAGGDLCASGDVALILLDTKIAGGPIAKVRTARATMNEKYVAVGYGADESNRISVRRQRTGVDVVAIGPATETFTPSDAPAYTYALPAGELATSEAACHGDSGGPLFDAQGQVVGVTSRGTDPNDVCVARPDIFTAVEAHLVLVDMALAEAGFPQASASAEPAATEADGAGSGTSPVAEDDEPAVRDASALPRSRGAPSSSGCGVGRGSSSPSGGSGVALVGLGLLALALARASRARRSSTWSSSASDRSYGFPLSRICDRDATTVAWCAPRAPSTF